jgi:hypothetical protein
MHWLNMQQLAASAATINQIGGGFDDAGMSVSFSYALL